MVMLSPGERKPRFFASIAEVETFAIATVSKACFMASISSTLSPRPCGRMCVAL